MFDELHDAYLLAVIADGVGGFELRFKTDKGNLFCIKLEGVKYLRCDNFREGNIVQSISIISRVDVCESDIEWILGVESDQNDYIQSLKNKIINGDLLLFKIIPIFGAELRGIVSMVIGE